MVQKVDLLNMCTVQVPDFENKLNARFRVHQPSGDELPSGSRAVRALIPGPAGANTNLIDRLPHLEIISVLGAGYDQVDVPYAVTRGIVVTNTPDILSDDVADLAIALMMMVFRKLALGDRLVRQGGWKQKDPVVSISLTGKRLGIVGLGRIGKAIAARAAAMKMSIAYSNRNEADAPYRFIPDVITLARESDVLIVAASAGPDARHIVNLEVLQALGSTGILINVARGSMVDEVALVHLLQTGQLAGAGLDVFEHEPAVPDALLQMQNVVVTPHIGSGTAETRVAMGQMVIDNLIAHFEGKPLLSEVTESRAARK